MSSHADSALVHAVLAGEVPRFGELVARYDTKVRAVVGRLLADPEAREDAVQETFYRAFRHLGDLDRPERFGAWLVGICLLYTSPSPRDQRGSRMPSSA